MSTLSDQQPASDTVQSSFLFKHGTAPSEIEHAVWSAFRRGNRKALDYIFEKYIRLLYTYGGKISKDQGVVEDCIQDLFVELWNKREVLSDTDSIKFYLLKSLRRKIARRLSVDQRHLGQFLPGDYETEIEFSIELTMIREQASSEQRRQLTRALTQLSKRQSEAVYLKFYEKMSYEQIAGVMNLNVRSAYNLVGKAIDVLRKVVKG